MRFRDCTLQRRGVQCSKPGSNLEPTKLKRLCLLHHRRFSSSPSPPSPILAYYQTHLQSLESPEPAQPNPSRPTLWHSAAHLLGWALTTTFPTAELVDGPPLDAPPSSSTPVPPGTGGFYYDAILPRPVNEQDMKNMQKLISNYIRGNHRFYKVTLPSPASARTLFSSNASKLAILDSIPPDTPLTAYRVGDFVDLCRGPHVSSTRQIGHVKLLTSTSVVHPRNLQQQRVYGIAFGTQSELDDWVLRTEQAQQRDHRVLGSKQQLFAFHESSPGSAFMLPHGALIQNRLVAMIRDEYASRGFDEVSTPVLYRRELWAKSGHLEHYKDDMFFCDHDMGLKPMNCPGHCELFAMQGARSHRQLPQRLADFSPLHRNELSGALSGLTRLRRFHQDDAHIFCTPEQVRTEIASCLDFVRRVYGDRFGFKPKYRLSTRPAKSVGSDELWDRAEQALQEGLEGLEWTLNPGDGAFYGPKIDLSIDDAMSRAHQVGTIQLDFQLPERFDLKYVDETGATQRPVMIHRAILGSLERFMAILLEHTNGKLPFWLSPRQVAIVPVVITEPELLAYCDEVERRLRGDGSRMSASPAASGLSVHVDRSTEQLAKKIRRAQQAPFSVIAVVGRAEIEKRTVVVRSNDGKVNRECTLEELEMACRVSREGRANEVFPGGLLG